MPRQRSLMTVIRDLVQHEVRSAIQSPARRHLDRKPINKRSASPSSQGSWHVASRRSRSPAEGGCGEGGAEEGSGGDACSPEGEKSSAPSQASSRTRKTAGLQEQDEVTLPR